MRFEQFARYDVVSTARLTLAGYRSADLARAVLDAELVPLIRGWYAVRPPKDARDQHRLRTAAAFQRYAGRALVSHQSLVVAQGLPDYGLDLDRVHLTRREAGPTRNGPEVKIHRPLDGMPQETDRVPTAVGIVQTGLEAQPISALVAADAALNRKLVTPADLGDACSLLTGCRGIGPVRAILREADARVQSAGESVLGHRMRALGYRLTPQFEVVTDLGRKFADFRIDGTRVLLEFDGAGKYDTRGAAFEEKRREDAMRRRGWFFARFVWAELDDLGVLSSRAERAISDSRRWAA